MEHIHHIQKHREHLDKRWKILRATREFFWARDFVEVETPLILRLPGQEPYLHPMPVQIHNETGEAHRGYLHTSPEYTLKKMLAAGYEKIFSLGKTFRDQESFGGMHNPEFTMIEWYRAGGTMWDLMDDVEDLLRHVDTKDRKVERIHMRELWQKYVGVNLDLYISTESMRELCEARGYKPRVEDQYDDLFYRIFLNEIEPKLAERGCVIVHHYPAPMAALARLSPEDSRYAERVEVYVDGIEIANGFGELTDPQEQRRRLEQEQSLRKTLGKEVFNLDEEFIEAVGRMPPSAGIALGFDRLVQLLTGCKNIDDVLVLPASKLFQ